uniref:Uncharacterized protein n=1 Tax=Arundo donax TaxID=35708 RepID=A0A0A9GAE3_ARUDO
MVFTSVAVFIACFAFDSSMLLNYAIGNMNLLSILSAFSTNMNSSLLFAGLLV